MRLLILVAILALASMPARAAAEPEGVYAKYHRAVMAGDLDGMLEHNLALQRAETRALPAKNREEVLLSAKSMMPNPFTVER